MFKQLLAAAIFLFASAAHAGFFNYSYVFGDGTTVAGSFSATVNGDFLTDFSNISASIDGEEFFGNGNLANYGYDGVTQDWVAGQAVATLSGTYGNFIFAAPPELFNQSNFFRVEPELMNATALRYDLNGSQYAYDWDFAPSRWTVTAVTAVPEPESLALFMAGLGLMGVVARRRKTVS